MLLVLAAMLVVAAAVPVIAQDYYQDYVEPPVEGASDYVPPPASAEQCAPVIQFGNTGNFNNAPGYLQYDSTADAACEPPVQQSSAASS